MARKSGIHINPANRGKFTASAKPGESTQAHASRVLNNPNASTKEKQRANFARNARKWRKTGRKGRHSRRSSR